MSKSNPVGNTSRTELPTIDEVALGAFFEDIGKFMQRAFGSSKSMPEAVRARESQLLPPDGHGRYTHKHALWSDAFFDWMARENLAFPSGIDANRVRDAAVYHHTPSTPLTWLSAVADRLSAGMDRKARDEAQETKLDDRSWDAFRKVPLACIFDEIKLGLGKPGDASCPVDELTATTMFPRDVEKNGLPNAYARLWQAFCAQFAELCNRAATVEQFHEGLLALSERFTWAIPSSTIDQPDVSLHDHNRTVAAFAACLYRHHEARNELDRETAIKDRERPKFRVLTGDVSGIQASLFRLRSEGVKGVNRILRARSFLIGQIAEAGAIKCRGTLGLPPYCIVQSAGGRFQLLVPETDGVEAAVERLRSEIDAWMLERYYGDLVLNLALSPPLAGKDFDQKRYAETQRRILASVEDAKQRPLASIVVSGAEADRSVLRVSGFAEGACDSCGVRPATEVRATSDGDTIRRCRACDHEESLGARIPRAVTVTWRHESVKDSVFGELLLSVRGEPFDDRDPSARRAVASGWRLRGADAAGGFPVADRFVANHVPHLEPHDFDHDRYASLSEDAKPAQIGDAKQFEHLAADAREWLGDDKGFVGRAMLSVVKADVDRLGFVFGCGLGDRLSVSRAAQLSRMVDAFFTGFLDHLVRTEFPNAYVVYSGGDDVLLIAPWLDGIRLAKRLREEFRRFVNGNPNITLSAGIEFVSVSEPLNRAVRRAEDKLEHAKQGGRDKVTVVVDHPIPWTGGDGSLDWALATAEWLNDLIRRGALPSTFLYTMLSLDRQRRRAEQGDPAAANWRSRWGYHLFRLAERVGKGELEALAKDLDALMCSDLYARSAAAERPHIAELPDPRIPITIAIYRNR